MLGLLRALTIVETLIIAFHRVGTTNDKNGWLRQANLRSQCLNIARLQTWYFLDKYYSQQQHQQQQQQLNVAECMTVCTVARER